MKRGKGLKNALLDISVRYGGRFLLTYAMMLMALIASIIQLLYLFLFHCLLRSPIQYYIFTAGC